MTYDEALTKYKWTPERWQQFGASGGVIDGNNNLVGGDMMSVNPLLEVNNATGLMGLSNGQWNNIGQASGLAGTAVGLYSKLFGDEKKSYELNKRALETNMANVAEDRARHKAFTGNFGGGFNKAMGQGLAASATRVG